MHEQPQRQSPLLTCKLVLQEAQAKCILYDLTLWFFEHLFLDDRFHLVM